MTGNLRCVCVCRSVSELLDVMTGSLHTCLCRRTILHADLKKKIIYLLLKRTVVQSTEAALQGSYYCQCDVPFVASDAKPAQ